VGAVREMCHASQCGAVIWEEKVPVPELTYRITTQLGLDPMALLSSGAMLIAVPNGKDLVHELAQHQIPAYVVGRTTKDETWLLCAETGLGKK